MLIGNKLLYKHGVKHVFERNCAVCGSSFTTANFNKKTCSKECHLKHRREYLYSWERNKYKTDKEYLKKVKKWHRESYQRHKKKRNKYGRKYFAIRKTKAKKLIGEVCIICGSKERRLIFHEIHGKKHKLNLTYALEHYQDFIPLCQQHHGIIHMLSELPKEKIEKIWELVRLLKD